MTGRHITVAELGLPYRLSRVLPLVAASAGLVLLCSALVPGRAGADASQPEAAVRELVRYAQQGEYTVEKRIWIDAKLVADPDALADQVAGIVPGGDDGIATAQYKLNSHKWGTTSIPVPVYYSPAKQGTNPDAGLVLKDAVDKWNAVTPTKFTFTWMGTTTREAGACDDDIDADGFNTVAYSNSLSFGVLGSTCTLFKGSGAPIEEFDMVLDSRTPWSVANTTPIGWYDLHSTMLHEMGHAAGIGHPCETKNGCTAAEKLAVMFAFLDDGEQRRALTADDQAALLAQYPGGPTATPTQQITSTPTSTPTPTPTPTPFRRSFQSVLAGISRD